MKKNPDIDLQCYPGLSVELDKLSKNNLYRRERVITARHGAEIVIDGKRLVNFCSNDYLSLADHPDIKKAMQLAVDDYGSGSASSPLVSGKSLLHQQLEETLAEITGRDRALIFSCGYMANIGIITTLANSDDHQLFQDRLCHASVIDGARLTGLKLSRYQHANPDSLERFLKQSSARQKLVLTESVFSMDGDIAPLPELSQRCHKYNACLVVDDAHGFGVIGEKGLGGMDYYSMTQADVPLFMATFGKAFGVYGAFVAGHDKLIETVIQRARPYTYSTALPVPIVAAVLAALKVHAAEPERRTRLHALIKRFRAGAAQCGIDVLPSDTPIQPLIVGTAERALKISQVLEDKGLFIGAIRPPTVPKSTSRLRITLSAGHTNDQIDHLIRNLEQSLKNN